MTKIAAKFVRAAGLKRRTKKSLLSKLDEERLEHFKNLVRKGRVSEAASS